MSIPPTTNQVQGPAIHVQGLEKSYKELRVLRGVDFEVARGSIFALLGSNGAGKTTVVKILSTLLKADTGTARVNGFDVATQAADVRESISLTGQFAAVDEILSGRENLRLEAARLAPATRLVVTRHVLFPLSRANWLALSNVARVIAVSEPVARDQGLEFTPPEDALAAVPAV